MSTSTDGVDRLTEAINDARIIGLNTADNTALADVITEFFGTDCASEDEVNPRESSDDEEWSDMAISESDRSDGESNDPPAEVSLPPNPDAADHVNNVNVDESDDDDIDVPVVIENLADQVVNAIGADEFRAGDDPDDQITNIQNWKCRCTTDAEKKNRPPKPSCILKLDPEFVLERQMNMFEAAKLNPEQKHLVTTIFSLIDCFHRLVLWPTQEELPSDTSSMPGRHHVSSKFTQRREHPAANWHRGWKDQRMGITL